MDKENSSSGGDSNKSHSPVVVGVNPLRRDNDSLDDFEHLEHDTSPVKTTSTPASAADNQSFQQQPHESTTAQIINTNVSARVETGVDKFADELKTGFENLATVKEQIVSDVQQITQEKMSSVGDLLGMDDEFNKTDNKKAADLLGDFAYAPPPIPAHSDDFTKDFGDFDHFKKATQNFMDTERDDLMMPAPQQPKQTGDFADRFSDSEPENDEPEIHSSTEDIKMSSKDTDFQFHKADFKQPEIFKDVIEEPENDDIQPELPQRDYEKETSPVREPIKTTPEIIETVTPEILEPVKPVKQPEPVKEPSKSNKQEVMGAEAMFCQMGLDAWFNPERLNPKVESLIYWRDPKKSRLVFGGTLVVLLSLAYFSFISVSAYLSLLALAGTISFRIYKNILQAVQKTSDGHPFKEQLEADVTLPQDKVREMTDIAVTHLNAAIIELRRLFLVEDLVDSIKFGVLLWCLTYLGAWFNGMTLIIIAFVALFTLPKIYENNKQQIDANFDIVRTKIDEITSKVKAAIPIGKKSDEKKE